MYQSIMSCVYIVSLLWDACFCFNFFEKHGLPETCKGHLAECHHALTYINALAKCHHHTVIYVTQKFVPFWKNGKFVDFIYVWLYMWHGYLYRRYTCIHVYIMQIIFVQFQFNSHNRINIMPA